MEVSTKCKDRCLEIFLRGELDHHGARGFLAFAEKAIEQNLPLRLILDFAGITFMDSSGIAVVLRSRQRMQEVGGTVILRNLAPQPRKVLDAANIGCIVTME